MNRTEKKMDKKELQEKITKATELGKSAFEQGIKAMPAKDNRVLELLKGVCDFKASAKILKAWNTAWHKANASAAWDYIKE